MEELTKGFEDLTYYDLLEIKPNASYFEIRQAYKEALSIYNEESLATYSFFSDGERDEILRKIEEAFHILIDDRKRVEYDRKLIQEGTVDEALINRKEPKKAIPLFSNNNSKSKEIFIKRVREKLEASPDSNIKEEILSKDIITGTDLKTLRESLGIELDEIFELTRINVNTLKALENDRFEKLPPPIYLENFLKSYADVLAVDPQKIVNGYLKNIKQTSE